MHIASIPKPASSRTLVACADAVWLWPGVPLVAKFGDAFQPMPPDWTRFWVSRLHGFEAQHKPVQAALQRAADLLTIDDEVGAQASLDAIGLDRLSPEGAALMRVVAERLRVEPLDCAIGTKSLPWGTGNLGAQAALFDDFAGAASELGKAWNRDQPRWPKGAPDSQGGRFSPSAGGDGVVGPKSPPEIPRPGIGHNGGPPLDDLPDIPFEAPTTAQVRNAVVRSLARWALKRGITMLIPGVGEAVALLQIAEWIYDALPFIRAG